MEELKELERTKKLNKRQELFCQEYCNCLIGIRAYMKAYPDSSYDTARANSHKLLNNTDIQARIDEIQAEARKNLKITPEFLVAKSLEVIQLSLDGEEDEYVSRNGQLVRGELKKKDKRAINDAIKNIAAITGLNVQKIQAEVQASLSARDVAKQILED